MCELLRVDFFRIHLWAIVCVRMIMFCLLAHTLVCLKASTKREPAGRKCVTGFLSCGRKKKKNLLRKFKEKTTAQQAKSKKFGVST